MKSRLFLPGIISLALVSVLILAGCPQNDGDPPKTQYSVSFDGGGATGDPPASQRVNEGDVIELPGYEDLDVPDGKEFEGWKANGTGTTRPQGYSHKVIQNVEFVAQWKGVERTVTFHAEGGTPEPSPLKVESGKTPGTLPTPTKAGFTFDGWYTAANGGGSQFTAETVVKQNMDVYANWKAEAVTPTQFMVTFNAEGGTPEPSPLKVESGKTPGTLPTPTKAGFTLEGWYTEKNGGGNQFTAVTPVTKDITVYAKWKSNNPLLGAWMYPDSENPQHFVLFTDTIAYYSYAVTRIPRTEFIKSGGKVINLKDSQGNATDYMCELAEGQLLVKNYYGTNNEKDLVFNRREGSAKTGIDDLWIPYDLSDANKQKQCFLIRATGDVLLTTAGSWTMVSSEYRPDYPNEIRLEGKGIDFKLNENKQEVTISLPALPNNNVGQLKFVKTEWY